MSETQVLTVHASTMNNGSIFLWGTRSNQGIWDVYDLKNILFAWHKSSFYGTFMDSLEWNQREGIELHPIDALYYFNDPKPIQHFKLRWSTSVQDLMVLAPAVKEALDAGNVMPDYAKWKLGLWGWKLQLPKDMHSIETPAISMWIDALLISWVNTNPVMKENLLRLQSSVPRLTQSPETAQTWLDEEDWLISIGWNYDATPMRTCLRIIEPEYATHWQIHVVLQDRANPELTRTIYADGQPMNGEEALPAHWLPELPHVQRDLERWHRLVPALFSDQELVEQKLDNLDMVDLEIGAQDRMNAHERQFTQVALRTELDDTEAWSFLSEGSSRLIEAGYTVFLPAWWMRIRKSQPRLRAKVRSSSGSIPEPLFGLQQLIEFDWRLAIGDIELSEEEFRLVLEQKKKLIQIRGNWIHLDSRWVAQIEQILKKVSRKKGLTFRDLLELHFTNQSTEASLPQLDHEHIYDVHMEVELNHQLQQMMVQLTQQSSFPTIRTPSSFQGSLRHYQTEGASWLLFLRQFGLGGCLADDMGLGKTIQWITYLMILKEQEPFSTPSLLICPTSVLGNWQMELKRFAPSLRIHLHYGPQRWKGASFAQDVSAYDLVLTSYTLSHLDIDELKSVRWNCICLDEAQNIKNAYTKQSITIRGLQGNHRIALTGTPIENRLSELWSIFDFINPSYLGTLRDFHSRYIAAIEKERNPESIAKVQRLIRPFLLRRLKKDPAIQLDLPEKSESNLYVSLTVEQGTLYENYIQEMFQNVDKLTRMERRGLILKTLTQLKQLCNHPALVLKEGPSAKWRDRSNKLHRLLEMVQELHQEGDKCLIFTQFVETGHLIQSVLERELDTPVLFLHGGVPKPKRDEMIAHFQNPDPLQQDRSSIFILSLKAGGVGLNLTAANHVFHYDRWWNPAVEQQATDRVHRIGQERHVHVYKFVTLGTLEERIHEMIERKQGLSDQIVGGGEHWITELSTDELQEIFSLRKEWA
jgi:SNF2 family DNA or RNA helicase